MQGDGLAFSTEGQKKPFEYWHDVVCQKFTALSTDAWGPEPFAGRIRADWQHGAHSLSTITASAQIVRRSTSGIARRPSHSYFVNIQLAGRCAVHLGEEEILLSTGDIIVVDADRPFSMQFDRGFRQACLHLNRETEIADGLRTGTVLRQGQPGTRPLFRELAALPGSCRDSGAMQSVSSLLRMASDRRQRRDLSAQHLAVIKRYVLRHSDDPDLAPAVVARHFCISTRHLHNLFAQAGESFGQYLLHRRLQKAQARLTQDTASAVSHIAQMSGFATASHFSRTFRHQFGTSPGNWRHAMLS